MPQSMSSTKIILLPKLKGCCSIDQFRPISLCNFAHKILSNLLNNRLKAYLGRIISLEQIGFVEGRNIHESIGIVHDLIRDINHKAYGGNILVKLDMSKAYDRLSWLFLLRMFRALGFSHQWCDLIYRNISNCWYSISWGGESFGFFKSNRGVRQGDPLSPTLFVIAMEFFSRKFNAAIYNGVVHPFMCPCGPPPVHHLLYADDMVVFTNGRKNLVRKMVAIIQRFCSTSGQMLNPDKSCIFLSTSIKENRRISLLDLTGFKTGLYPVTYLGAPLFPGRPKIEYFIHLEECIKAKISGWTKRFLSIIGRATLIASVLGSLSIHTLFIIHVPKGCLRKTSRELSLGQWRISSAPLG
ncbi:hypothetical protein QQ045_018182 [Rhodiola kirilowii]